ncbi:MAG: serine protease AprX [Acidobacteriota bacterium]|jgi:hypothetical protein|nr:serine protease AprX [Acidobacteriota bacterium]
MRRQKFFQLMLAVALGVIFAVGAQAAPKVDPQLKSKLATAKPTDLFGVILTFKDERVTDAQVAQVLGLGISGGYRMNRLPVVAVNATPAPALSGVVANILEANRNLTPDEVRDLLVRTATPLATYDEFEVGAGLANVHAAGNYTLRVTAGEAGAGVSADQPYVITVRNYLYNPSEIADVSALDSATRVGALRLVYDRVMSADGGLFRPEDIGLDGDFGHDLRRVGAGQPSGGGRRVGARAPVRP